MCGMKLSFRSNMRQRNFVSSTTGIGVPFSSNTGSGCSLRSLQKCMQTVLEVENLKPFVRVCSSIVVDDAR